MSRLRPTKAVISLPNLRHNLQMIKNKIGPQTFVCPMVKANGYGHGDVEISKCLEDEGVSALGVVLVEEGVQLRYADVKIPILVFGVSDRHGYDIALQNKLTPVLSDWDSLMLLSELAKKRTTNCSVHLKFNTGMSRLGFPIQDAKKLYEFFEKDKNLKLEGIATHLLNGEDAMKSGGYSERQLSLWKSVEKEFQNTDLIVHYLNSSAIFLDLQAPKDFFMTGSKKSGARPGISLYGVMPPTWRPVENSLKPVMSLQSKLELVRSVPKGQTVSYGARWTAQKDSVIGIVPIGYADGYLRAFSNKVPMLFRGKRVPVAGTVCMDYTMVDLTELSQEKEIQKGEDVVLFNEKLTVAELAEAAGTIPYEVLVRIGARVYREYIL